MFAGGPDPAVDRPRARRHGSGVGRALRTGLYAFSAAGLLDVVRDAPDAVSPLLLVGHNPAIQELARTLASRGEGLDELARKYPTGAMAEIAFTAGSWREVAKDSGELVRFVRPRDLDAGS